MAQAEISDEISRHVAAVLVLSKRDILFRLLREAEFCLAHGEAGAAAILADIALEELHILVERSVPSDDVRRFEAWRERRNRAAHAAAARQDMGPEAVASMLLCRHPPMNF